MWYEMLPPFTIMVLALATPGFTMYYVHQYALGNHFRRTMSTGWDRATYLRDDRLTGNPYKVNGLEALPDK